MCTSRNWKTSVRLAAACAALGLAGAVVPAARADVLLSNFEFPLGGAGLQGWFNYNGNVTSLSLVPNPTGGSTNWMAIEYNNTGGAWTTAGPTIQPWANSNFSDTTFQAHNFLQFDVIFPSDTWLSSDPALPVGLNSNGGGDGLLQTVNTTVKDSVQHVVIDYSGYKSSNGGPGNITDWMNLLFGYPDETQWNGAPFVPRVLVDNIYLTSTSTPPAVLPTPNSGSWDPTKSGNWTDTSNWIGGIAAHGTGNTATFGASAAPRTVTLNTGGITLGQLVIDSPNAYTFTGSLLTLQSSTANPNANAVTVSAGSHSLAGMSVSQASGDTTVFTIADNAALTIDSLMGGGFGSYAKEGGGALVVDKMRDVNLTVNGGSVTFKPGNLQANGFIFGLSVFNGSTFNLNGAQLRVNSLSGNEVPGTVNLGPGGGVLNMGIYGGASFFGPITGTGDIIVGAVAATDPSAIGTPQTVDLGGDSSYAGATTVTNGNTLNVSHHNALGTGALVMETGTRVNLTAGFSAALRRTGLTIAGDGAPTATLDMANNGVALDYTGSSPLALIVDQIEAGANTGTGIITSLGANYAVGYVEASALSAVPSYFGSVDSTTVLFRGTRAGDSNLDGLVNLTDFNALAANFGQSGRLWHQGDFNYDGIVNLTDFNRLAANFGLATAGPEVTPQDWSNLAGAVPEPAGLGLLALSAGAALRRRRRSA